MMRALYTAATGMAAGQINVDTIANNLANVNTNGYKTVRTEFKTLLYQTIQSETTSANGEQKPVGAQVGLGTRVASTTAIYSTGAMLASESPTDFALEGDGFFAVRGPEGEMYFTRSGNFSWGIDGNGNTMLKDTDGYPVLDREGNAIYAPEGVSSDKVVFQQDGRIGYQNEDGEYVDSGQMFGIYRFRNSAGLERLVHSRLRPTEASGEPILEDDNSFSRIRQYYLEGSNVQVADEMINMIVAQRAYEVNSKAIHTADAMLETANNLKR